MKADCQGVFRGVQGRFRDDFGAQDVQNQPVGAGDWISYAAEHGLPEHIAAMDG